jgi:hypothetical protein
MNIAPIKTQRDVALKGIENLMAARRGTAEGDHLDGRRMGAPAPIRWTFPTRWKRSNTIWNCNRVHKVLNRRRSNVTVKRLAMHWKM